VTTSTADLLKGRVLWVTGAGKGLGRAIATTLAQAGATVAVTARTESDLASLVDELSGLQVRAHPGSVSDPDVVRGLARTIRDDHGGLDGLVNCAGVSPSFERSESVSDETWTHVLEVNLTGTFYCCREAGAIMLEQGSGTIANISSIHATSAFPRIAAYAASKGGIESLTRTLAVEWADRGVRVNTVAPGYFTTELSRPLLESRWAERVVSNIPMRRTGAPAELSGAVAFLMSDASSYVTGSTISVDGGWTA
jgi:NAD(P)-dependent dehydrogenase (short-subunit alcohol dehydrogenase family)